MSKRLTVCLAGLFLLTCAGCGANPATSAPAAEPSRISSPRQVEQDLTPLATPTDLPPTPTETLLPTPELPTPISLTPVLEIWTGTPILTEPNRVMPLMSISMPRCGR